MVSMVEAYMNQFQWVSLLEKLIWLKQIQLLNISNHTNSMDTVSKSRNENQ